MNFSFPELKDIPSILITLAIAFTFHEFSHAFVANKFGDPTAKNQGRLTLNPLSHVDPLGAIFFVIFGFGWAKPVPVNYYFFKNPRLAGILTSLAGPASNLILAFIGFVAAGICIRFNIQSEFLYDFFDIFTWMNIVLFLFNLFPIPPLDGFHIIQDCLSRQNKAILSQYEKYSNLIFFVIVLTPLSKVTIDPVFDVIAPRIWDALSAVIGVIV
ncbi:MAG: site-2 protease family protein [Bacillales bacterium]|jgi:Zn-dependent protease|nr:site-2 protease family protein [Bacillales bacterium]